jgi:ribosomal protein L34E
MIDQGPFRRFHSAEGILILDQTPGGKLRYLHIKKKGTAPKCGVSTTYVAVKRTR